MQVKKSPKFNFEFIISELNSTVLTILKVNQPTVSAIIQYYKL